DSLAFISKYSKEILLISFIQLFLVAVFIVLRWFKELYETLCDIFRTPQRPKRKVTRLDHPPRPKIDFGSRTSIVWKPITKKNPKPNSLSKSPLRSQTLGDIFDSVSSI